MPKSDTSPTPRTADAGVIRLLLLGDSAVGKSSLLLRFCEGRFENNFVITIGVDFKTKPMSIDGKQHRVQVWDTEGQERFRTITPAYYRNAMGVLILFDVTNKKSFDNVDYWVRNLDEHGAPGVQKVLVGNKIDLSHKRKVPAADAQALADKYGMLYFETSAKDDTNVEQCFFKLSKQIADKQRAEKGHGTAVELGDSKGNRSSSKCCQSA
jgi:small GTP-binding protein